jgi:polar amino acid transport system substrate-binding protein
MQRVSRFLLACLLALPIIAADLAPTGTLRAAFLRTNPVQGRIDPQTKSVTGPVADLVQELARRLGVPYNIIPAADARDIIGLLNANSADIGFLAYDAARAAEVDFSRPYALMQNCYLVRADSPIHKSADADKGGLHIGAAQGQSQAAYLKDNLKNATVQILAAMPSPEELQKMLVAGELDAFGANRQRLVEVVASAQANLRVLPDNFSAAEQAIVITKGDRSRLEVLNRFIADACASGLVKTSLDRAKLIGVDVAPTGIR